MDIVPKDNLEFHLSEQARIARKLATPTKAKHKLLAAADEAFDLIGGVPRFAMWADQNQTDFYKLYAKTLPQNMEVTGEITIRPALPPSALDEPIDVTPTTELRRDAGAGSSAEQRPIDVSPERVRQSDARDGEYLPSPDRDRERSDSSTALPEGDGENGLVGAEVRLG